MNAQDRYKQRLIPIKERLYSQLDRSGGEDSCWEWQGVRTFSGYGRIKYKGKSESTHRLMYKEEIGPIPEGFIVCHKCDNPPCGNPKHFFLGTHQDNTNDAVSKGRHLHGDTHPVHKNPALVQGDKHPNAKITQADAEEIRRLRATGEKYSETLKKYPIKKSMYYYIINKTNWNY